MICEIYYVAIIDRHSVGISHKHERLIWIGSNCMCYIVLFHQGTEIKLQEKHITSRYVL